MSQFLISILAMAAVLGFMILIHEFGHFAAAKLCGTLVTLRYNGRSIRVPVIDRGPYVEGREFDLTLATKEALGFGDTGEIWSTA